MNFVRCKPTQEEVRELLNYDADSGIFYWRVDRRSIKSGSVAGSIRKNGYRVISINDYPYYAHRLAFLYMEGRWPIDEIDHIDTNKDNNKWENLREVTKAINQQNKRIATSRSSSGVLGVSPFKNRYKATIMLNGKSIHLGYHKTIQLAHAAYIEAKRKFHIGGTI